MTKEDTELVEYVVYPITHTNWPLPIKFGYGLLAPIYLPPAVILTIFGGVAKGGYHVARGTIRALWSTIGQPIRVPDPQKFFLPAGAPNYNLDDIDDPGLEAKFSNKVHVEPPPLPVKYHSRLPHREEPAVWHGVQFGPESGDPPERQRPDPSCLAALCQ
jgi:hypothetical protein